MGRNWRSLQGKSGNSESLFFYIFLSFSFSPSQILFSAILQGVASPLAGQMVFRATLFSAFGASKRWLATNEDGTTRQLTDFDFFKAGAITGFAAAFAEAPIDFYKSQIQVQIIRSKADPTYTRKYGKKKGVYY